MEVAVSADGTRIAYETVGYGPPVLLHHGFSGSREDWRELGYVDGLRDDHQLILIDARGHGQSDKPHDPAAYAMAHRVADVVAVLDALGIERAHYWGYSMGGRVGYGFAALAPQRLDALIIGGSHPFSRPSEGIEAFISELRPGLERWVDAWEAETGPLRDSFRRRLLANDLGALIAEREAGKDEGSWERALPELAMPCLLYAGGRDEPVHSQMRRAAEQMPNARFISLPDLDHERAMYRIDQILPDARAFLASADRRAA